MVLKGKACFESITCLAVGIHVCRQDFPVGLAHSCCVPSHSPSTQGNGIVSELTFAVRHAEHERGRRQLPHWNVKELSPHALPPFSRDDVLGLLTPLALVAKRARSVVEERVSLALAVPTSFVF